MKKTAASNAPTVSFRDWVAIRDRNSGTRRKGERTRDRIRLCTISLLNERGYRDLRLSEICKRAKISPPVFYLYFRSKEALVHGILLEFLQEFISRSSSTTERSAYKAIYDANLQWIQLARANAGLMRCLLQFSEEQQDFALLFARESNQWNQRITSSILRRFPAAVREQSQIHFVVSGLSGMMDELTRRLFADREPHVTELVANVAASDEELADMLSVIWFRSLYCSNPPEGEARPLTPRLIGAAQPPRGRTRT